MFVCVLEVPEAAGWDGQVEAGVTGPVLRGQAGSGFHQQSESGYLYGMVAQHTLHTRGVN